LYKVQISNDADALKSIQKAVLGYSLPQKSPKRASSILRLERQGQLLIEKYQREKNFEKKNCLKQEIISRFPLLENFLELNLPVSQLIKTALEVEGHDPDYPIKLSKKDEGCLAFAYHDDVAQDPILEHCFELFTTYPSLWHEIEMASPEPFWEAWQTYHQAKPPFWFEK
jgi:hypothetical protein